MTEQSSSDDIPTSSPPTIAPEDLRTAIMIQVADAARERVVRWFQIQFALLAVIISVLGVFGYFQIQSYIENLLAEKTDELVLTKAGEIVEKQLAPQLSEIAGEKVDEGVERIAEEIRSAAEEELRALKDQTATLSQQIAGLRSRTDVISESVTELSDVATEEGTAPVEARERITTTKSQVQTYSKRSAIQVMIIFRDRAREIARTLSSRLAEAGFQVSLTSSDLTETLQHPEGTLTVMYNPKSADLIRSINDAAEPFAAAGQFIVEGPKELGRGDVQILVY